jgi:hypothetical protein
MEVAIGKRFKKGHPERSSWARGAVNPRYDRRATTCNSEDPLLPRVSPDFGHFPTFLEYISFLRRAVPRPPLGRGVLIVIPHRNLVGREATLVPLPRRHARSSTACVVYKFILLMRHLYFSVAY